MKSAFEKIKNLALQNNGYIQTKNLIQNHISKTHLSKMMENGQLARVKQGLYRLNDIEPVAHEFFLDAQKAIPEGIICLLSALDYYELSTINPNEIHVAIPRNYNYKGRLPDYPPVKIHQLAGWYYRIGIQEVTIRGGKVNIYSREKTLCDCIKYRDKIGADLGIEAFKNYLRDNSRDIPLLIEISEKCKVDAIVKSYAEVLI